MQNSFQALTGKTVVNDITLTGTAEWIAGSDDETGTTTYKALAGASRLDLALSKGTRSEIRSNTGSSPTGNWTGPGGVSHPMASHNLVVDAGWFPSFLQASLLSSSTVLLTYVGPESRNGTSVIHISASQQFPNLTTDLASQMQHLSQVEIFLDPTTFLPVSYAFNIHPDDNELLDIPSEIRYSNYQNISGVQIPLHAQKFVNNTLTLDLQFQNASINTGITATQISAQ